MCEEEEFNCPMYTVVETPDGVLKLQFVSDL